MTTTRSGPAGRKAERLNIRISEDQKRLVEQAASLSRQTTSQFVMQAALRSAEEALADSTRFVLPPEQYKAFTAALDRPAREILALKKAASRPSPFRDR